MQECNNLKTYITGDWNLSVSKIESVPSLKFLSDFLCEYSLELITKSLADAGECSLNGVNDTSFIDHIACTNELAVKTNETLVVKSISNFSDHLPVCTTVNFMINMDNMDVNGKSVYTRANWSADSKQLCCDLLQGCSL